MLANTETGNGDEAMVTCPGAPENFEKQVVDNVAILRWEPPSDLGSPDAAVMHYIVQRAGFERIVNTSGQDTAILGGALGRRGATVDR